MKRKWQFCTKIVEDKNEMYWVTLDLFFLHRPLKVPKQPEYTDKNTV